MRRAFEKGILLISAVLALAVLSHCRSARPVVKESQLGKATEFHREPAKLIPAIFVSRNTRGLDIDRGFGDQHVNLASTIGGGLGLFVNTKSSPQWIGHKFFYYYIDAEISPERSGVPYPGEKKYVISTYPGIYIRTYIPLWMKLHWGLGTNIRFGSVAYDRWGVYTQAGLEFFNITASTIFIVHPGQTNMEVEYRVGYLWSPFNW